MWIKLHLFQSGDEVIVQTQNICAIYPDQRKPFNGATVISFTGAEENYILVREPMDENGEMIAE